MIDKSALLADLRPRIRALEADLRERSAQETEFAGPLRAEWEQAHKAGRTAATYETWLDGEVTQAAAAWVLGTVFLRFCEDNGLIDVPYLAGPGDQLAVAVERQQVFFERSPHETDRDWIIAGLGEMADASPVAAGLFDQGHNPMWRITPSHDAVKDLLAFWRERGSDGTVARDFTDSRWDTRFLGDLYQDLSDHAQKAYALLQTPEFIEEFILRLTLKRAIDEFGLEPEPPHQRPDLPRTLRVIDPACGSGHFLLGAFKILLDAWERQAPGTDRWVLIRRVLDGLHGVDKNPFAVSIARFRLLLAIMKAGKVTRLKDTHDFPLNIAVGDSLLHGRGAPGKQGVLDGMETRHTYQTENVEDYIKSADILGANSYQTVVGNPPYIGVKDSSEKASYRQAYRRVATGKFVLSVPFMERFFSLAVRPASDHRAAGYIGQITSNTFMTREYGRGLIENFLAQHAEITHVIDTSGLILPGHGTPTVILIGRNMPPTGQSVRVVLRVRGQSPGWSDPAKNPAWRAIVDQIDDPGSESDWIAVSDLSKRNLATFPWILADNRSESLLRSMESERPRLSSMLVRKIGFASFPGQDEAFIVGTSWLMRKDVHWPMRRPLIVGEVIRDWGIRPEQEALVPFDQNHRPVRYDPASSWGRHLWTVRRILGGTGTSGGRNRSEASDFWWTWYRWIPERYATPLSITFAFEATHNHFTLDRGGRVYKQTAPVIKLKQDFGEVDHEGLLGVLNSSATCFWLKQVCHDRGNGGIGGGVASEDWERFYEFASSKLESFPVPTELPIGSGRAIDELAQRLAALEPSSVCTAMPTRVGLDEARAGHGRVRGRMIAVQEELDWEVYRLYGLLSDEEAAGLRAEPDIVPELALGERAFEIVLARACAAGEADTQWFARHRSTPITEIPGHWPQAYREVVQRRIEVIGRRRDIALIERPECKRRWQGEPWEKKEAAALRDWLLERCERRELWFAPNDAGDDEPRPATVSRLADRLRGDAEFVAVARLYAGADADLADVVADITEAEHVPYLAALRYKDTGLRKRQQWEDTWELQRREDATGERLDIPVPPKYASADFRKTSYWSNRGKLDVPKERFISYPQASPDGDGSLLLGWAGWDHREQAHALMTVIEDRGGRDGWERDRLIPLIAGLAEVLPWVAQWHGETDPAYGMSPAEAYAAYLDDQLRRCQVSAGDLTAWRPPPQARGGRRRGPVTTHPDDPAA